jgi:hypothetical protein
LRHVDIFWETIDTLNAAGALRDVVLIGSWAEYLYQESGILDSFRAHIRTRDLDVLIPNIRRPAPKVDLYKEFKERLYLPIINPHNGLTKFDKSGELEVEFLVRELGAGQVQPYKVESLNVTAQGLRNLEILLEHSVILNVKSYNIRVPSPQAYILHKMVINNDRSPQKKVKDIQAIQNLLETLQNVPAEMENLKLVYDKLTTKQCGKVRAFCAKNNISILE